MDSDRRERENDVPGRPPPVPAAGADTTGRRVEATAAAPSPSPSSPPSELDACRATVASLEDRVRRQGAEFVNDIKRLQRQADERVKYAAQSVVEDILGVADALHRAIDGLKDGDHEKRVADGLRMVERQLIDSLAKHGVTRIDAEGRPFDPAFHQAVMEIESAEPAGSVVQVVRPGFALHGRVVRPAHVILAKAKAADRERS